MKDEVKLALLHLKNTVTFKKDLLKKDGLYPSQNEMLQIEINAIEKAINDIMNEFEYKPIKQEPKKERNNIDIAFLKVDKLIATKIMGWEPKAYINVSEPNNSTYKDEIGNTHENFAPTTNIKDAWRVVKKLQRSNNWEILIQSDRDGADVRFRERFTQDETRCHSLRETTELAICEAALVSINIEMQDIIEQIGNT